MIYAVGDIHGQLAELERVLALIDADGGSRARVVFLGDYVDRGPDSRGVVDRFLKGLDEGRDWVFLKGNHDAMFQRFLSDGTVTDDHIKSGKLWLHPSLGGNTTLASYLDMTALMHDLGAPPIESFGFDPMPDALVLKVLSAVGAAVPEEHRAFFAELALWHEEDDKIFVHAGVRPGVPMGMQDPEDLFWIREPFLSDTRSHGALIVHGHTALEAPERYINRVNLDSGAGYGRPLTAAVFDEGGIFTLTERGRVPL
ncbi:metallophosphoesterase family protein [Tropicibacter alexandrii]|uniref:metallophosphoesterase family protein n=1 Tax=Tropicibacter alexandrii TaxID=2267683 RepID=UPI000EF4F9D4|nr:metallophosphoesterase family protein [Tropicibacter alexandrii]